MWARYNYKKNFYTYQIFLPDVDGLINGSPVRYMGIQIGYVNQVDIVGDDVYVRFIVTQKDMDIPKGTVATVEFAGLGGSKSLELYPSAKKNKTASDMLIIPEKPKRIHDSLSVFNGMFENVAGIAYTISNFMNEVGIIKNQATNGSSIDFEQMLNRSNDWIDDANKQCVRFGAKIKRYDKNKTSNETSEDLKGLENE